MLRANGSSSKTCLSNSNAAKTSPFFDHWSGRIARSSGGNRRVPSAECWVLSAREKARGFPLSLGRERGSGGEGRGSLACCAIRPSERPLEDAERALLPGN